MKNTILLSIATLLAAPVLAFAATGGDDSVINLEKKAWDAYKSHQADSFKVLCAPDYSGVYDVGTKDTEKELADMNDTEIRSVSFSDMHVTHPTKDVAVAIYKADVQGAYKGKDFSGMYNCSAVWMDKGGKWLCVLHTEVKTAAP
jgi:Domain of unknown function (DUF4440)